MIMELLRNKKKNIRKNGVLLMASLASFNDTMKQRVTDIGGMKALFQLSQEI